MLTSAGVHCQDSVSPRILPGSFDFGFWCWVVHAGVHFFEQSEGARIAVPLEMKRQQMMEDAPDLSPGLDGGGGRPRSFGVGLQLEEELVRRGRQRQPSGTWRLAPGADPGSLGSVHLAPGRRRSGADPARGELGSVAQPVEESELEAVETEHRRGSLG